MNDETTLENACKFAKVNSLKLNIIATGSNIILPEILSGLTLKIDILGIKYDPRKNIVSVGAGENWHALVLDTINHNLSGLENLSLIPGSAGAAPIQNIGAYGVEFSNFFLSLRAIDVITGQWVTFSKSECKFGYRDSMFRNSNRYIITSVTLELDSEFNPIVSYPGVKQALASKNIRSPTALDVSDVICQIRESKLPNPKELPNVGSFFKNPIISTSKYMELKNQFTDVPYWDESNGMVKISAGALLDKLNCKGLSEGNIKVSKLHSLVLVNHGKAVDQDVLALVNKLQAIVRQKYDIQLNVEPIFLSPK